MLPPLLPQLGGLQISSCRSCCSQASSTSSHRADAGWRTALQPPSALTPPKGAFPSGSPSGSTGSRLGSAVSCGQAQLQLRSRLRSLQADQKCKRSSSGMGLSGSHKRVSLPPPERPPPLVCAPSAPPHHARTLLLHSRPTPSFPGPQRQMPLTTLQSAGDGCRCCHASWSSSRVSHAGVLSKVSAAGAVWRCRCCRSPPGGS